MLELFFITILIFSAIFVIEIKNLLNGAIGLALFSLTLTFLFFKLHALDLAMAEASIGAGISTVLLVIAISKTARYEE